MSVELAKLHNGSLALLSDKPFPTSIKRIEYYKEQHLFQLVFDQPGQDDYLVPRELDPETARIVTHSPDMMVVVMAEKGREAYGYDVPLVQIGL